MFLYSNRSCRSLLFCLLILSIFGSSLLLSQSPASHQQSHTLSATDEQALKHALDADDAGQLQRAEATLQELAKRNPENFDVIEALGLHYAQAEDFKAAYPLLTKAAKISGSAVAQANLGAVELKLNHAAEAVVALERAVHLDPRNPQTQMNLGLALMQTNQPKLAADAFGVAAQFAPHDSDLLYNWSVALLNAGDYAKAADVLTGAPDLASSASMQSLLGDISEHRGQFKEAGDHYQAAVKLEPSEINIYMLGMEFVRHWTFEPGIKIFEYGLSLYPKSTRLLSGQGIAKYANNNYDEAAKIFAQLLAIDPDNAMYADILGRSCSLMPDTIDGCSDLVEFANKHPKNATVAVYAATSVMHRPDASSDLTIARKLLHQALAVDANLADAYYQLGVLQQEENQWQESVALLEKCVALKPELAKPHYRLALAYSHTGQKERAREQFALQQKYSAEEKTDLDAKMKAVTTFLVETH